MVKWGLRAFAASLLLGTAAIAQPPATPAPAPAATPAKPTLIVAIAVDQFSADLFAQYRSTFTGGFTRLASGVVFPSGYQSHAATETCPGHSTILTGYRPGHTGIVANTFVDQSVVGSDVHVNCMEDITVPGSTPDKYTQSLWRLRVPTLGDRLKAVDPATRVMTVSGKDRGAMLLAGKQADGTWFWNGKAFQTYGGRPMNPVVETTNSDLTKVIADGHPAYALPTGCESVAHPVEVAPGRSVGTGRFERAANDARSFANSPELDAATLLLATRLVEKDKLGQNPGHTDILGISLSATDRVGHAFGPGGGEMCVQLAELDRGLGDLFAKLDSLGIDYMVVLTADHGGHDLVERNRQNAASDAVRVDKALTLTAVNDALRAGTGLTGDLILGDGAAGDMYLRRDLTTAQKAKLLKAALALYRANPEVQTVFTHAELKAAPEPSGPPEAWSLLDEAKASFDPERSGDFLVLLKPRVTPIPDTKGTLATHGSPWGYDRRVPILFWRKGLTHFEQPLGIETVDIMPTLAAEIGLPVAKGPDGHCLDLRAGPDSICPAP